MNLKSLISLEFLKGKRTQWTIIAFGVINFLTNVGIVKLSPEDLTQINSFLTWAGAYFFAEKVSK